MNEVKTDLDYAAASPTGDSLWEMAARHRSLTSVIGTAALFLMVLLAYSSAMRGDFVWDDDKYITANPALRDVDGLHTIWFEMPVQTQYYPLTLTTFWIEWHIWHDNPLGYHLVNVVLHACGAFLLWMLLSRLNVPGAWAAAAIWALHPVNVESVAWITERKNVLSGVFYFSSMMVYLRYCGITPAPQARRDEQGLLKREWISLPDDPTRIYALAIFLFACALLTKSVTSTLPAAVLVIIWWKRGRIGIQDIVPLLPFFALGIGVGIWTAYVERDVIGATGSNWHLAPTLAGDIAARCIVAGRAVWFYFSKLLVPWPLIFNYPRWNISPEGVWQFLFPLTTLIALVSLWGLRHRLGRGPMAGALFFVGSLFPALGFVNVYPMKYSFVADHFQYLPSIGIIVLLVAAATRGLARLVHMDALNPAAAPAGSVILLGALGIMTWIQGNIYRDLNALLRDTINQTGGAYTTSWFASNNYGVFLLRNGHIDPAEKWFKHTLKIKPDHPEAHFNLGLVAERRRQPEQALAMYRKSLELDPEYDFAAFKIATTLEAMGRLDEATQVYRQLAEKRPNSEQVHLNLGVLLAREGKLKEAIAEYLEALRVNSNSVVAHFNLANALVDSGNIPEALREYAQVVNLEPRNWRARMQVGNLMAAGGKLNEAREQFKLAVEYNPNLAEAHNNLGQVYMYLGNLEEAAAQFKEALKLAPKYEKAQQNLDLVTGWLSDPKKKPATFPYIPQQTTRPSTSAATTAPTTIPRALQ
jgi:tetratricopeptide (TPR) repeat protein